MRRLLIAAAVLAAVPAAAQPYQALVQAQDAQRADALEAARRRDIELTNELARLEARVLTDQALNNVAAALARPIPPPAVAFDPKGPPPKLDMSQMASIPDATLAASNARAVEASKNRR